MGTSDFVSMASGRSIRPTCQPEFQGRRHRHGPSAPPINRSTGDSDAMIVCETAPGPRTREYPYRARGRSAPRVRPEL